MDSFEYKFVINTLPKTQDRPRFVKGIPCKTKKMREYETEIKNQILEQIKDKKITLISKDIPIDFTCIFYTAIPYEWTKTKAHSFGLFTEKEIEKGKRTREEYPIAYSLGRGDIDNFLKAIFDSLNGVLIEDDGSIVSVNAKKIIDINPRIEFSIKNLT